LSFPTRRSSDLSTHNINPEEIDVIIVATVTPDMFFPATACIVQEKIGAKNAWGFDLSAACSGFLFAFQTGASFIEAGTYKKVLVIGRSEERRVGKECRARWTPQA